MFRHRLHPLFTLRASAVYRYGKRARRYYIMRFRYEPRTWHHEKTVIGKIKTKGSVNEKGTTRNWMSRSFNYDGIPCHKPSTVASRWECGENTTIRRAIITANVNITIKIGKSMLHNKRLRGQCATKRIDFIFLPITNYR